MGRTGFELSDDTACLHQHGKGICSVRGSRRLPWPALRITARWGWGTLLTFKMSKKRASLQDHAGRRDSVIAACAFEPTFERGPAHLFERDARGLVRQRQVRDMTTTDRDRWRPPGASIKHGSPRTGHRVDP